MWLTEDDDKSTFRLQVFPHTYTNTQTQKFNVTPRVGVKKDARYGLHYFFPSKHVTNHMISDHIDSHKNICGRG